VPTVGGRALAIPGGDATSQDALDGAGIILRKSVKGSLLVNCF
jgi:hypothetical protein